MRHVGRAATAVLMSITLLAGTLGAGTATAAPDRERVQAAMNAAVAAGVTGVLAAVDDRHGDWEGSSGSGDIRSGRVPDPDGRFRIASTSKTFTATVVLTLAQDGRFDLDDPVGEYLPGLLPYPERITIRQLLQHTSGLPRDLPPGLTWRSAEEIDKERFHSFTPAEVVKAATSQPLRFEPGTSWAYSNIGYTVLAMLAERVSGKPLERLLAERVLRPAGLHDTLLVRNFPFVPHAAMRGYEQLYEPPRGLTDVTVYNYSRYFGSGSMLSTAEDLNRFYDALLRGKLLDGAMLAEMKKTVPALDSEGDYAGFDYGLGLLHLPGGTLCEGSPPLWGHNGSLPGYATWSMHDEHAGTQITTAANRNLSLSAEAHNARTRVMASAFCDTTPDVTTLNRIESGVLAPTA